MAPTSMVQTSMVPFSRNDRAMLTASKLREFGACKDATDLFEKHFPNGLDTSLGRVLAILGREPSRVERCIAAYSYCRSAAYRGKCPGVNHDDLLFLELGGQENEARS
jgi:hypothetical protein